jgi:Transmembrane secretion effector
VQSASPASRPVRCARFRPRQMVSSLRQRNYRLFFFGQLVSVAGTWMQTVAQSFVVLDLTHSGTQLGLTTAARFGPMFLFGPLGGVFADRMDRRAASAGNAAVDAPTEAADPSEGRHHEPSPTRPGDERPVPVR